MTRVTSDIVEDLRLPIVPMRVIREAADKLEELAGHIRALNASRRATGPCPTCDDTMAVVDVDCMCDPPVPHDHSYPCPDCGDVA